MNVMTGEHIMLAHGAGGRAMRRLIAESFVAAFASETAPAAIGLAAMDDGAAVPVGDRWLILTTDSHIVQPPFFPGGDIGRLAVSGTINDLSVMGATDVIGLTCSVILEDGFPRESLDRIVRSMADTCREASAPVLTGDTKVMGKGELDGIVINTTGIGWARRPIRDAGLRPGDVVIVTGTVGDHGLAVMAGRHGLSVEATLVSDVAPINTLIASALSVDPLAITAMKDPTRGGVAGALHEMASKSGVGIVIDEAAVPVRSEARGISELVGIDPLLVANEGKAVLGVRPEYAAAVLAALRSHPLGRDAAAIGTCTRERPGMLVLDTGFGRRLLAEPDGELLPRIC
jgi:hydrogenase expression/formation protein HypE